MICCTSCQLPYPEDSVPHRCPACSGIFDFSQFPTFEPNKLSDEPGIWRYRHTFNLPSHAPQVYLGEGDTPLVWRKVFGRNVAFKLDFLNPTSSFKDRGTAVLVSFLITRGVSEAADDSSGNAGASFAAYAAAAGLKAHVFIPSYASGPKRAQIGAYGARLIPVPGPRSKAGEAVRSAAEQGLVYASHATLPHGLPGFGTIAYELVDQLGSVPGMVIAPVGQGTQLLALGRAFSNLQKSGLIDVVPQLVGVQALACAPVYTAFRSGKDALVDLHEGETLAEGVRIKTPYRMDALLKQVKQSKGNIVGVKEQEILPGQKALALLGFFVEPTSAIVWSGLQQMIEQAPDPVVVILTGAGLKAV